MKRATAFHLHETLHQVKHYLPSQMTLKDFIHHNSLHPFQKEKFYDGIFRASQMFGYKVTLQLEDYRQLFKLGRIKEQVIDRIIIEQKGEEHLRYWVDKLLFGEYDENIKPRVGLFRSDWKRIYKIDLDTLVHPILYRVLCTYLDQGVSLWPSPVYGTGFLEHIRHLEEHSYASFFRTGKARAMLLDKSITTEELLNMLVGNEAYYEQYIFDTLFSHRGWSGIISVIEDRPETLLLQRPISIADLLHVELLMEMDMLDLELGINWRPLAKTAKHPPADILAEKEPAELEEVFKLWQDAFEWSYYDEVIRSIVSKQAKVNGLKSSTPSFQAIFCIDERECSIRRHLEYVASDVKTWGAPGFFGVEFYYLQQGAKFLDKLCPAPVTPNYLIKEIADHTAHGEELQLDKRSHSLFYGFFYSLVIGFVTLFKLFKVMFHPKMSPSISDAFSHMENGSLLTIENKSPADREQGLQVGFTIDEMITRVENFLRNIGLTHQFSPLIYIVAHGSSSANNPHHGAHDCGACSGRPGATNARVFSFMANHPAVRKALRAKGIEIPDSTRFIPAMHDTASDLMGYYDDRDLSPEHQAFHNSARDQFEQALDLNAKERSRRFASIDTNMSIERIRKAIERRSVSIFEPRPELGHGTNTLCIIGRRDLTKGLFLDRRAFLNSYDYRADQNGHYLRNVMGPIGPVCGGINLEYYFSRVDNQRLGCGTKLPHNVMGLIGVANSSDGDLRPGLPWQMIEPHDPLRLLVIVEHFPEVVLQVIQSAPEMYEWYKNEWVHLLAFHPETKECFYFRNEHFIHYHSEAMNLKEVKDVHGIFEAAPEMMTNHITHATFENLPIYQINPVE